MHLLSSFRQIVVVTALNLATVPRRLGASSVAVVGIGGVVIVVIAVLSIGEGFRKTMETTGAPDRAIVMRSGADSEMVSVLIDEPRIIAQAPGIRMSDRGPLASAELYVMVDLPKRPKLLNANVPLRGVEPAAYALREPFRIVEGRRFTPGTGEIIAGRAATVHFAGLEVGRTLKWGENRWTIVGIFDAGGSATESELWCDARVLQSAYRRGNSFQSVRVQLEDASAFSKFKDALTSDPRLNVKVTRETEYYAAQAQVLTAIITSIGYVIAALMGIGAVFAALNTMYSAVTDRTRDIATLRALGFGAAPVVVSVMVESMLLATIGGLAGGALAWTLFNGYEVSTLNWQTFSQVAFAFAVTPSLLVRGILYSLLIGLVGGLLPAIRAARRPIVGALREL